ncbi:retinol dehydrogenase 8-like [Chiloscyllium plagiosum]|uniref:retinol dehydrogenase 8-like n=1 Tax=Chiloscyllium plagiosum TaxID=36176 RepID=UPI001CB84454|nr:retinol dehydrogenase 8-like [Chiloscyllium plagiosum]
MSPRTVVITGCSSGIGLALAVKLAKDQLKRFKVIATMRDLGKKKQLEDAARETLDNMLEIKELDVCSEDSICKCVNSIPGQKVDILVSNAGMGLIGPVECQSLDTMKMVFDTNFFGLTRLVKEILPDMKRRQKGHIVVMSSVMGIHGLLFNDVYSASKFAVEGFCESLAIQALKFNINISLIEPGPVITEFEAKLYEDAAKMDLSSTDEETAKMFRQLYLPYSKKVFHTLGQTADDVAEHTVKVITSEKPPFRYQTNSLYTPLTTLKFADPTGKLHLDTYYKMIFQHDRIFNASLSLIKFLRGRSGNQPGRKHS